MRDTDRKNNDFIFTLEKEQAKWALERQSLNEKIKNLEESTDWEKSKSLHFKNDQMKTKKPNGLY